MRRLFKEEKTGLRTEISYKSGLVFFIYLTQLIYPQIPINGFCSFKSIEVPAGFEHIIQYNSDFNDDPEFMLYSPGKKEFIFIESQAKNITGSKFSKSKSLSEISSLVNISKSNRFAFTSRKNRIAGLIDFISYEKNSVVTKLEFDSYPENIYIEDVNADGIQDYLVSGSGFDGLSILYLTENILAEKKIVSGSNYQDALFTDLSNDGVPDILAYNLINRTLEFYYNDSQGSFDLVRAVDIGEIYGNVLTLDLNKDGYDDIVYSEESGIRIIYGDPESKFSLKNLIKTEYPAQLIVTGDFNKDNLTDLAYLDKTTGIVSVIFAMKQNNYFDEIIYARKDELSDLKVFKWGTNQNIAVLSKSGTLNIFSSLTRADFDDQVNLVPSAEPDAVGTFDIWNDKVKDIYYLDRSENLLMLFVRNKDLIPVLLYSIPLAENYTDIRTDESFSAEKTFYCYSKGSKLIEVVRINFKSNKIQKKQLYSPGLLEDLKIKRLDSTLVEVYVIYHKTNKLHLGEFEHRDLSITFKEFPAVDLNVVDARLILNGTQKLIYYWKEASDTLIFLKAELKTGPIESSEYFRIQKSEGTKIFTVTGDYEQADPFIFSMLVSNKNNTVFKTGNSDSGIYFPFDSKTELKPKNILKIFFIGNKIPGSEELMVYIPGEKSLSRFEFFSDEKNFKLVPVLQVENLNYYVIDSFDQDNNHLIYSNNKAGCISIITLAQ